MRGGRIAGRVLLAMALVALPLIGLAVLSTGGSAPTAAATRAAVLGLAPGQGGDAVAVTPAAERDPATRGASGARHPRLLAALLGTAAVLGLAACRTAPRPVVVALRAGRRNPAAGRGPPHLLPR